MSITLCLTSHDQNKYFHVMFATEEVGIVLTLQTCILEVSG
jgi:hypothetical protein